VTDITIWSPNVVDDWIIDESQPASDTQALTLSLYVFGTMPQSDCKQAFGMISATNTSTNTTAIGTTKTH